ncbi:MAG: trypsin-like peptidase domain-containing protein [Cocleimonas sp.]|nr:trypsin-like peptidase domain-containing protein [Cocleimonas sp.]
MSNIFITRLFLIPLFLLLLIQVAQSHELPNFTNLVKNHSAAVVNISTEREDYSKQSVPKVKTPETDTGNELIDDLMKRIFDGDLPESRDEESNSVGLGGSGFIISSDGYVVTNRHVVEGADKIFVKLSDRRELSAKIIGSDKSSDIALLKVEASNLPVLTTGSSRQLEVGEWVVAIGSPFGFDHSVTAGIVSAKGRSLPEENYVPFIQTDVAINPGNSGGPLFNMDGDVIGVNSQIYSRSGGFMGVSFAIPIDVVKNVVQQLKIKGYVQRGWLGVFVQEVTVGLADSFGLNKPVGALVAEVIQGGPAASVLRQGDVILKLGNKEVNMASDLPIIVSGTPINEHVKVKIFRKGHFKTVKLKLRELPVDVVKKAKPTLKTVANVDTLMGMELDNLTEEHRQSLSLQNGGVLVKSVALGAARKAGIESGDVIKVFNNQIVPNVKGLKAIINQLPNGTPVAALVLREGTSQYVALKIDHKTKISTRK